MEQKIKKIKEIIAILKNNDTKILLGGSFILKEVYQLAERYEDIDLFLYPLTEGERSYSRDSLEEMSKDSNVKEFICSNDYNPTVNSSYKYTYDDGLIINIVLKPFLKIPSPIPDNIKWNDISIVPLMYILRAKQCYSRPKDIDMLMDYVFKINNPSRVIPQNESEF